MAHAADALLGELRRRGIATARQLMEALGISQPTLSRLVARRRDELVVFGRARSVRYAARDARSEFASGLPIFRVRADGRVETLGTLIPLSNGQTALLCEGSEPLLFAGLPWFIEELRPEGFLGRLLVKAFPPALQLPPDARLWRSEHLLRALVFAVDDVPGDLLVGQHACERYMRARLREAEPLTRADYSRLVEAQLAGETPGSSAAGEQPKFTAGRLLVKYSPPIAGSAAARRWADLLRCEDLALRVLRASGYAAAESEYVEHGGRAYLEVVRFDRSAEGRLAVISGRYVDAEFVGSGAWVPMADGLARQGLLAASDAELVRIAHYFGGLIGNTHMHLGNIAFFTDNYQRFRLAPLYDMLPMGLRPNAQGELPRTELPAPYPTPEYARVWLRAADLALAFFERVLAEPNVDSAIHAFAERQMRTTKALRQIL